MTAIPTTSNTINNLPLGIINGKVKCHPISFPDEYEKRPIKTSKCFLKELMGEKKFSKCIEHFPHGAIIRSSAASSY